MKKPRSSLMMLIDLKHWRFFLKINIKCIWISHSKCITLYFICQIWRIARNRIQTLLFISCQIWHTWKKSPCIRMTRIEKDILCLSCLYYFSSIHNIHIIGDLCNYTKVMCDKNNCNSKFLLQIQNQLQNSCLNRNIKCRCRLITD